jgi:hypothetical protein
MGSNGVGVAARVLTSSLRAKEPEGAAADAAVATQDTPANPVDREPNFFTAADLAAASDTARMIVLSTPASFVVTAHW